jgi:hypothetical protein
VKLVSSNHSTPVARLPYIIFIEFVTDASTIAKFEFDCPDDITLDQPFQVKFCPGEYSKLPATRYGLLGVSKTLTLVLVGESRWWK